MAEAPASSAGKGHNAGLWPKIHFAVFVSMCVVGAVVFVDTGPFPLNLMFGAFAIALPFVLVIWRRRSVKARRP